LRFARAPKRTPDGAIVKQGFTAHFALVLTDKHWELEPGGKEPKEVASPQEWRIENPGLCCITSLPIAIRYVAEMRDKSKDPAIRKNADRTLVKLKSLR
jgi:hypothetical protein